VPYQHIGEQELVKEGIVAFLEDIEVDVLFKFCRLRTQLSETSGEVVDLSEAGGDEFRYGLHWGQGR